MPRMRAWRFVIVSAMVCLGGLAVAPATAADSGPGLQSFDQLIASMKLVVLARISGSTSQGYTYAIEHVLKGSAGPTLVLPPDLQAAVQPGWTEAVIAFSDPTTDDFRTPTIAWHVGSDGTIDPEKFQQYPNLPPTLGAMLAYFGVSTASSGSVVAPTPGSRLASSLAPGPTTSGPPVVLLLGILLAIAVLAGSVGLAARRRPRRTGRGG